jgi:hypothetical protein
MIIRGTTPYHSFILPLEPEQIQVLYITYLQNNTVILDKEYTSESEEITIEPYTDELENASMNEQQSEDEAAQDLTSSLIMVHLTQEDTLNFHFYPAAEKNIAVIQIRVLTTDGEAYASEPIRERIFGVLKDGVIGNE